MSPFILLLLGGAAVAVAGKKKTPTTTKTGGLPPESPPPLTKTVKKSGSGYPGVTREKMQWIQTTLVALGYDVGPKGMDGRYGSATKTAVLGFQMDYMPRSDGWDGKPGSKTRAALEQAEAGRKQADQCDPIDPGTWGTGNVCTFDGSRWVRKSAAAKPAPAPTLAKNVLPPIEARQVGFSADYSKLQIGAYFKIGVLDAWLNDRRQAGLLITKDHADTLADYFIHDPGSYIASILGAKKATGDLIYGTLITLSTAGMGLGISAVRIAAVKMASSLSIKVSTIGPLAAAMEKVFGNDAEKAALSAAEAFADFAKTHNVRVGDKYIPISSLPKNAKTEALSKFIVDYIMRFQQMHF